MKLNENIRNFRRFRNMSQADLAKKISKSKSVISHWESGENSPDLDSCEKLCKILNVTPNQLFGWEKNPEYESHVQKLEKIQCEINVLYDKINNMQKEITDLERLKYEELNPFVDDDDEG